MGEDGDRILDIVGILLVAGLLLGVGTLVLAGLNAPNLETKPPDADWRLERVNETHVRIVHDGGEPVYASKLAVVVVRYERHPGWTGLLVEGDAGVVQAAPGDAVSLTWSGGRGDRVRIARWPNAGATTTT